MVEHGRKGLGVVPVEPGAVRDLYRVRAALDVLAALEAGLALPPDAASAGTLIRVDAAFHAALYRLARHPAIGATIAPRWPHLVRAMGAVLLDDPARAGRGAAARVEVRAAVRPAAARGEAVGWRRG